jgi:arginyl-tRNA synthetase
MISFVNKFKMKKVVVDVLSKELKVSKDEIENLIEIPPADSMGDYAFPCFGLAKKKKKNPMEIASDLCESLRKKIPKEISNVDFKGAYVNFFLDKKVFAKYVLKESSKKGFGKNNLRKGKRKLIEFSQPNTHKAFHVGHIRGTVLGESLARISEFSGEKVVRANYSGDTGMHIAKWIWCYSKYHSKESLRDDEKWIADIYVEAVSKLDGKEEYQKEVEDINRKIEDKSDLKINSLWKKTREASINSWKRIYNELGTYFDKHYFESEFESDGKMVSEELLKKKVAKKDDAIFVDLKKYDLGTWVLLRRDGTVLYSAKDLALAMKKVKDFSCDNYLVAIGEEQRMHFLQLQKTLELMKFEKAKNYSFLTFGMVRFPDGKMSSRTGKNILYSEFSSEVRKIAKKGLKRRGYVGKDIEEKALTIAIAAIKYSMLKQDSKKTLVFDPKEALSFEGDTGPYLLYSYARANSIIEKVKEKRRAFPKSVLPDDFKDSEIRLLKKISEFPAIVFRAYDFLTPHIIANYSFELAKIFNEFYHDSPVLGSSAEGFRLELVSRFKDTLKKSLGLLGIETLERM